VIKKNHTFTPSQMANNLSLDECIQTQNEKRLNQLIDAGATITYAQQETIINHNLISSVRKLLERGFRFDNNNIVGSVRSIEMIALFVVHGFNIKYRRRTTLLHNFRTLKGDNLHTLLEFLMANGFNMYNCVHNYDFAPGDYLEQLNEAVALAIRYDNRDLLRCCDEYDPGIVTSADKHILFACVFYNAINCAQYLLDRGIDRTLRDDDGLLAYELEDYHHNEDREPIKHLIRDYDSFIKKPMEA
jgi:hypothetical protein